MVKQIRSTVFKTSKKSQSGFTIVELLIAVAFFSFILLFISAGFVALNRQFVKGRTARAVQSDARFVIEDITRNLRESSATQIRSSEAITTDEFVCLGSSRYVWASLDESENGVPNEYSNTGNEIRLARTDFEGGACNSEGIAEEESTELIGQDIAVQFLDIRPFGGLADLFEVVLVLSTRQEEIIGSTAVDGDFTANCLALQTSGSVNPEFCTVVKFETIVKIRN